MAWITPKVDWISDDYINFTDYNRICNNLDEVKNEAEQLGFRQTEWQTMEQASGYSFLPHADDFNKQIENYNLFDDGILPSFQPITDSFGVNGYTITYNTLNALENGLNVLHTTLEVALANIPRLAITLGGNNKLKI
jgi:hypothetical protein